MSKMSAPEDWQISSLVTRKVKTRLWRLFEDLGRFCQHLFSIIKHFMGERKSNHELQGCQMTDVWFPPAKANFGESAGQSPWNRHGDICQSHSKPLSSNSLKRVRVRQTFGNKNCWSGWTARFLAAFPSWPNWLQLPRTPLHEGCPLFRTQREKWWEGFWIWSSNIKNRTIFHCFKFEATLQVHRTKFFTNSGMQWQAAWWFHARLQPKTFYKGDVIIDHDQAGNRSRGSQAMRVVLLGSKVNCLFFHFFHQFSGHMTFQHAPNCSNNMLKLFQYVFRAVAKIIFTLTITDISIHKFSRPFDC